MRETPADTARAIGLAVLVHVLLFVLLMAGLWWTRDAAPAASGAISAELMDASDLSQAMQRTLREKPEPIEEPEPLPEPLPEPEPVVEQPKPQDFIPLPDEVDQEEVTDLPTPVPSTEDEVQEAKQRQEQVDLTEQQRQQEAQRQQRLTEMERQRQQQIEDLRRRRAASAREADLAEERLKQLASARAGNAAEAAAQADAQASGEGGDDDGLRARYAAAIQAAVRAKWTRPDSVVAGSQCRLLIRQLPGGRVISAQVTTPCALDEQGRRSVEAAVLKAQPLPYAGFESVFNRELNLNFKAEDR